MRAYCRPRKGPDAVNLWVWVKEACPTADKLLKAVETLSMKGKSRPELVFTVAVSSGEKELKPIPLPTSLGNALEGLTGLQDGKS